MRRESLLESVMKMPWPVGVGFAVIVFVFFQIFQLFYPLNALSPALASMFPVVAYGFCGLFLFGAFLSFLTQIIRSRRFRTT